ncbi:aminoacyl-tRNA hydrolase [Campylobacter sp. LH-2024]|uniref:aminoacyl-tRNA hydrolase n=1 Tax=Campylobacter TaxID=194 RepID=UPI001907301C|nr:MULTISPECIES: aminoacyl-tRNA hydrolase [unclassified Campylobacter]MBZ7927883.1 aminoacyl-tRNA hydrolase [Campylobacter sp. RM10542]MBZ7929835.1 aminoacyl-tRNA hydrolase [Campylobacter sp. W0067]MBZ7931221.1 aminoacyl-tRNA hydrolase [Campylobacter sp. RM12910]MBZ7932667.1 aminoacyl-tRNA hydrolase [Campylobacter sp. RM10543]MBZ7934196.1 aminoacyl-tRNA hydrolase [Campylobacter sp. W0065]MBZ7937010.1 aminoacyl-tRNA hydrolase [Campylobacter sp. RM10538]MBZ7945017.1 aminoacyl-tRNA hydrolase [C
MILVVGLGNIGEEYKNTRHNVGFMLIDLILKDQNFTNLTNSKFKGELFKIGSSLLLLKPSTYMNNSGISVKAVKDFYKCERIIVIHDDIDINLGALRFKKGGSSGGHNGLKSIDSLCGNDYERIRIGVGKGEDVISHVLGQFNNEEKIILDKILEHSKKALFKLVEKDLSSVSSLYSLRA